MCLHVLLQFNQTGHGSVCSQAIMLVTDGATEMYDDVFERYNWPERKVSSTLCFCFSVFLTLSPVPHGTQFSMLTCLFF